MNKNEAWDFALNLIKIDGLQPSKEFLEMVEKEKNDEVDNKDIEKFLYQKYNK